MIFGLGKGKNYLPTQVLRKNLAVNTEEDKDGGIVEYTSQNDSSEIISATNSKDDDSSDSYADVNDLKSDLLVKNPYPVCEFTPLSSDRYIDEDDLLEQTNEFLTA